MKRMLKILLMASIVSGCEGRSTLKDDNQIKGNGPVPKTVIEGISRYLKPLSEVNVTYKIGKSEQSAALLVPIDPYLSTNSITDFNFNDSDNSRTWSFVVDDKWQIQYKQYGTNQDELGSLDLRLVKTNQLEDLIEPASENWKRLNGYAAEQLIFSAFESLPLKENERIYDLTILGNLTGNPEQNTYGAKVLESKNPKPFSAGSHIYIQGGENKAVVYEINFQRNHNEANK